MKMTNYDPDEDTMYGDEMPQNASARALKRSEIKDGDVVAFEYDFGRGVALMRTGDYFHSAYNLFRKDECWGGDTMPPDLTLLAPTEKDIFMAIEHLYYNYDGIYEFELQNSLWLKGLSAMDSSVRLAVKGLMKAIDGQTKMQTHIVKRWKLQQEVVRSRVEYLVKEHEDANDKSDAKINKLNEKVQQLTARIRELEQQLEQQRQVPTEDAFVNRMLKVAKSLFKYERGKADCIRQVMAKMGRDDAEADLDAWIEGRRPQTRIRTDRIEVQGNLNARQVNEIHDNDSVEMG